MTCCCCCEKEEHNNEKNNKKYIYNINTYGSTTTSLDVIMMYGGRMYGGRVVWGARRQVEQRVDSFF